MKRMNRFLGFMLVSVMFIALVLSGCGPTDGAMKTTTTPGTPDTSTPTSKPVQETVDPFGKYEPAITVRTAHFTTATTGYPEGDSAENNIWTRAYRDMLGINVQFDWIVDEAQLWQKMNVTIASGDLPDIFPVNGQQLNILLETDKIADLTDVCAKWISPQAKSIIDQDLNVFELGKRNGKLYAIANTGGGSAYDQPFMLWVREDWRLKLNLSEPKTMDDFFKIAEAFVTQDPDGNNQNDTYALALTKTLHRGDAGTGVQGFAGLTGFANAYHAYPGIWIKDASGKIVYGSIQPELKDVLLKLQEMYKNSWLDKEFAVKDSAKVSESTTTDKIGMEFGQMWNPFYPLLFTIENNPQAEWQPYPVPSIDDKPAMVSSSVSAEYFWVVRKGFEHPEAAIKMLNLFTEKCWGETADNDYFNGDGTKIVPFKYALVQTWPALKNINAHKNVAAALPAKDPSKLNAEEKHYYDQALPYLESGDVSGWGANKIFGQNASFDVINYYMDNKLYLYDEYHNIPTPTMVERSSTLEKMEIEVFMRIIMGADIEEFDKFVEDWKKLGGDDITKEMNDLP